MNGTLQACLARIAVFTALLVLSTAAPAATSDEGPEPGAPPRDLTLDELRTFADVFNIVRNNYVDEVPAPELLDSALRAMVAGLDPHSAFLGPEAFQDQDNSTRGRYGGIGVELRTRKGRLVVDQVIEGGPAWLEGVKAGDRILAVDGKPVKGRPLRESMNDLLGPPDTTVTVQLRRDRLPARDVELVRQFVPVPSVRGGLLEDDIAFLQVNHFHLETATEFERNLERLRTEAGGALGGIVIDLRDNPGGIIKAAANIADGFLEEGLVVYTRGRYPASYLEYHAEPGEWAPGIPVAVLVNSGSASASEILAGALQDHARATVIGTETYGKGTVQSVLQLRNGSALKLTTARYFTPSGRSFDRSGISPDVAIGREASGAADDIEVPTVSYGRGFGGLRAADPALKEALSRFRKGEIAGGG